MLARIGLTSCKKGRSSGTYELCRGEKKKATPRFQIINDDDDVDDGVGDDGCGGDDFSGGGTGNEEDEDGNNMQIVNKTGKRFNVAKRRTFTSYVLG